MDSAVTYKDSRESVRTEQSKLSREEVAEQAVNGSLPVGRNNEGEKVFAPKAESVFDPETVKAPEHNWIDRGDHFSCEGALHDNHKAYKRRG